MAGWQMIAVGVRRLVLARGELDRLEGPGYAARREELRRRAQEAARTRDRQASTASQNASEESDATDEEATWERIQHKEFSRTVRRFDTGTKRGMGKNDEQGATARWHDGHSENLREYAKRDRKRRTPKGGRRLAHLSPLQKIPVWWRRAVLPSLPWVIRFLSFLHWARDWRALKEVAPRAGNRTAASGVAWGG